MLKIMSRKAGSRFAGKKILFGSMVTLGLLMAGQAFAVAYAPGTQVIYTPDPSGNMAAQAMPQGSGQMKMYVQDLQNGNLSPSGQMEFYKMMQGQMGMPAGQNVGYQVVGMSGAQSAYGKQMAWVGLMVVMTVVLVWVNLLLLIAFLWKQLKKHKHN